MWNNKNTKHMYVPWTFRRVWRVWGFMAALRYLLSLQSKDPEYDEFLELEKREIDEILEQLDG